MYSHIGSKKGKMIIEIRKVLPSAMILFYLLFIVWGFNISQQNQIWNWVFKGLVSVFFICLSSIYQGIRINTNRQTLEFGIGLFKLFKPNDCYPQADVKQLTIHQLPDLYYGLHVEFHSGEKRLFKKIATLDKAQQELAIVEKKMNKFWS
jgi:hypothetical protein